MRATNLLLAPFVLAASASSVALAQNTDDSASGGGSRGAIIARPGAGYGTDLNLSVMGGIGSYGNVFGFGVGAQFGIPIVREGFIRSLNESFHLEFGLFTNVAVGAFSDFAYFSPVGGVRWDFHIFRELTAYAALRTGVAIGVDTSSLFYFDGAVGGFWRFSKPVAIRFELGGGVVGGGVSGGVAFWF